MRLTLSCVFTIVALAVNAAGAAPVLPEKLMVVLDFKGPHSNRSVQEMKNELETILDGAGLELNWSSPEEATKVNAENLVVVQFNGACILKPSLPTCTTNVVLSLIRTRVRVSRCRSAKLHATR